MVKKGIIVFVSMLLSFTAYSALSPQTPMISTALIVIFVPVGVSYTTKKVLDIFCFLFNKQQHHKEIS